LFAAAAQKDVLWQPGTDRGIATQMVVERQLMEPRGRTAGRSAA
jgi:valyl-tRNA synthetase